MKKTLAMILALMMLLACVPAMAEDIENPYEEYGVEIQIDPATGKPYDLGGMVITIADWWSSDWHDNIGNAETAAAEATEEYRLWIEETYNFTIKNVAATTWSDSPTDFTNIATTGSEENYVWILRDGVQAAPMAAGLFYDWAKLDCIDLTDDKWFDMTSTLMTVGDSVYGVRPGTTEARKGIFFNKRLLAEAGVDPESIYDMQADGTWTWAAFEELLAKLHRDTDNDGIIDRYAMMSFSSHIIPAAVTSNMSGFVLVDENGNYYNAAESDATLEAVNWVVDLLNKYEMAAPEGAEWNYFESAFINGEVAIQCHEEYFSGSLANMEDDYGFVMFPKGPQATQYQWAPTDNISVIPANYDADRAWKIAFAYNLFTNDTPGYDGDEDWKNGYYTKYRDDRAVDETINMMMFDSTTQAPWYVSVVQGYDLGNDYLYDVYAKAATPAEQAEAMRGTWQAYIDEANK
ncbi:MAG: hypothetical protein IJ438_06320 [Clostridia bacterium]|nr:hypothetical protein [Clostridia bacterium]